MTFDLTNKTIEQNTNISIYIEPQLTYTNAVNQGQTPQVTLTFSDSQITKLINCTGCLLVSSKRLSLPYYSILMNLVIEIKNSRFPKTISQNIGIEIKYNTFIYEAYNTSYTL